MPIRLIYRNIKLLNFSSSLLKNSSVPRTILCGCQQYGFSWKPNQSNSSNVGNINEQATKPKTKVIPKITLIQGNELSVTTLEEAQKLSKRRDLKLVKIVDLDTKTQRPVYKLMTGSEYHAEDLKQREQKKKDKQKGGLKGEKVLIINHNISEHDLQTDVRKITKWTAKSYEVRIIINGDSSNMEKADRVYNYLENSLKSQVRIFQKRQKGADIRFQIYPPKEQKSDNGGNL